MTATRKPRLTPGMKSILDLIDRADAAGRGVFVQAHNGGKVQACLPAAGRPGFLAYVTAAGNVRGLRRLVREGLVVQRTNVDTLAITYHRAPEPAR